MPRLYGRHGGRRVGTLVNGTLPLFVYDDVLDSILDYSATERQREIGGFLIGNVYRDDSEFLMLEHFLPASDTNSKSGSVTFTHQTWEKLRGQIESGFPDSRVIGWHHTHPSMGIFLSQYDQFIHRHFFNQHWQIAMVVDPCREQFGFFQWQGERIVNNGFIMVPEAQRRR